MSVVELYSREVLHEFQSETRAGEKNSHEQIEPSNLDILKKKYSRLQQEQTQVHQSLEGEIAAMDQRLRTSVSVEEMRATKMSPLVLP